LTPSVLRKIIALNIMGNGVFLMLVSISKPLPDQLFSAPDPVPQAMVLTGIVVAISSTALALALLRRYFETTGDLVLPEDTPKWGCEEQPPPDLQITPLEDDDEH